MAVPARHLFEQGPVLRAIGRTALAALLSSRSQGSGKTPDTPGPETEDQVPPRPEALVRDYLRHVGGDPSWYRGEVPAHLFPQWGFPLASRTLSDVPYPLLKVLNYGCRLEMNQPLPADEPLAVRARLESIDDDGRRAIICQRVVTGTASAPEAVVAYMYAYVPLGKQDNGGGSKKSPQPRRERPRVPDDVRELAFWKIGPRAGLEFAMLTGDFNPVHWIPPYAKAFGFRGTILHGFATLARAVEGLNRGLFAGDPRRLETIDVRFSRPLVLPARVGLYVQEDRVLVGDAPGGGVYLEGSFTTRG